MIYKCAFWLHVYILTLLQDGVILSAEFLITNTIIICIDVKTIVIFANFFDCKQAHIKKEAIKF